MILRASNTTSSRSPSTGIWCEESPTVDVLVHAQFCRQSSRWAEQVIPNLWVFTHAGRRRPYIDANTSWPFTDAIKLSPRDYADTRTSLQRRDHLLLVRLHNRLLLLRPRNHSNISAEYSNVLLSHAYGGGCSVDGLGHVQVLPTLAVRSSGAYRSVVRRLPKDLTFLSSMTLSR